MLAEQYFFCDVQTPKTIMIGVRCSTKELPTRLAVRCDSSQTICQYRNMYCGEEISNEKTEIALCV